MKIVITGSLGNIGEALTKKITDAGHSAIVISSNANRQIEIEKLGATAAIGSLTDLEFLKRSLAMIYDFTPAIFAKSNIV